MRTAIAGSCLALLGTTACALAGIGQGGATAIGRGPRGSPIPSSQQPFAACPVTLPNFSVPPDDRWTDEPIHSFGNDDGTLFTQLWPAGTVLFEPGGPGRLLPDGSLAMKWPWYRTVPGKVVIQGHRLDAPAPPMPAITLRGAADGYGATGFHPSGLVFPTEGCWQVTATVARHSLEFIVRVVKSPDLVVPTAKPADLYIRRELTRYGLYPIPASCPIDPLSSREVRYGLTAWYWDGDGLGARTAIGVLFEGENAIQWHSYGQGELSIASYLVSDSRLQAEVSSMRTLDMPAGQVVQTMILFPNPGCYQLHGNVGDQVLDITAYVYPASCRPQHLQDPEVEALNTAPCEVP